LAESLDSSEDFICGFGPSIRLGIFIVPLDEGSDICLQLLRRGMDAATNLLPGELGKPAVDWHFKAGLWIFRGISVSSSVHPQSLLQ
jgi:hypothetical protein